MQLQEVGQNEFASIFGNSQSTGYVKSPNESGFGGTGDENSMFKPAPEAVIPEVKPLTPEEETQVLENADEPKENESIFEKEVVQTKNFDTVKSIFEDLIKNNQLLPLADDKLETPEDIQALVYSNVAHQVEELRKDENNAWYASKSPAWSFVAAHSEKLSNPSELIPLLQSVEAIEIVSQLDSAVEDDAERIVRMALVSRNEPQDIIEDTITTYKDNGKLTAFAERYKPALVKQEQKKIADLAAAKEQEEIQNYNMIKQIHEEAVKVLETPFLGKHKMKKEEKASIYNMIAAPDENTGGYRIFSAIDNLYETNDFEKLRKIALILQDETAYNSYIGLDVVKNTNEGLLRKIKATSTGSTSSDIGEPGAVPQQKLNRNPSKESGFGYFQK